ncbi:Retrotransposon protein [Musa troglodytarum]|uniref:Retrotransposon protein n=1 Tax=Musa troglodytarum TaxID=320322 RepID=A0A9E7I2E7_9LILI|nr:Retrotransposon protein [Musa troglodytarum]
MKAIESIAVSQTWRWSSLDMKMPFLHGDLEEEIYMEQLRFQSQRLKKELSESFVMKDIGPAKQILGMQISRDRKNKKIWLSQKKYIEKSPSSDEEKEKMQKVPYASAVGSLMYAMVCTRSDIAYAVGVTSRFLANLGKEHWAAVKWVLRYLIGSSKGELCHGNPDCKGVLLSPPQRQNILLLQRNCNMPCWTRDKEKTVDSAQSKCLPRNINITSCKHSRAHQNESMMSPRLDISKSSAGPDICDSSPLSSSNGGSKRTIDSSSIKGSSMRLTSGAPCTIFHLFSARTCRCGNGSSSCWQVTTPETWKHFPPLGRDSRRLGNGSNHLQLGYPSIGSRTGKGAHQPVNVRSTHDKSKHEQEEAKYSKSIDNLMDSWLHEVICKSFEDKTGLPSPAANTKQQQ